MKLHVAFLVFLSTLVGWIGRASAVPLVIDGSITTNACPGGAQIPGGRGCQYGGTQTFDYVSIINGGTLRVTPYNGTDKAGTGNLVLRATGLGPSGYSIYVDRTSQIDGKGAGYQGKLCDNGAGPAVGAIGTGREGGRGGCGVRDSGGGGSHYGNGGRGTKDNPNLANNSGWEEDCVGAVNGTNNGCVSTSDCRNNDALPTVAGQTPAAPALLHSIYVSEFGAAGGDKGCRDDVTQSFAAAGNGGDANRAGDGGGRIVLFAGTAGSNGVVRVEGRIIADGRRGCAQGNDSAGGGGGGVVYIVADRVEATEFARVSAHGGRGGDAQPKCLPCTTDADCHSNDTYQSGGANVATGQTCQTVADPMTGRSFGLCQPCNCKPCSSNAQCDTALGQTCKALPGYAGGITVCADSSNQCTPIDRADNEGECANSQNLGLCDDCGGGGGGGIIRIESRTASLDPRAIFDVRGAKGGICPVCEGEAGGGVGELQLDAAYVGEICDGYDNDFDGATDEGLGTVSCPGGPIAACSAAGVPQDCTYNAATCQVPATDTRPRFALILDTSGSMLLDVEGDPTFGDGSVTFPGVDTNSDVDTTPGNNSRLYIAKRAVSQVLSAFPESDYALARYYQDVGTARSCQTASSFECSKSCCSYDAPTNNTTPSYPTYYPDNLCIMSRLYPNAGYGFPDPGRTNSINIGWQTPTADCINYAGSCGPPRRGAQYLVGFGSQIDDYLMWLNGTETNFLATTVEGQHCQGGDCELRGTGPTPLAGALQATQSYLTPIATCDAAKTCRTYSTILLTDGVESCQGNAAAAATALRTSVAGKDIKTYVIGFSIAAADRPALNAIATAGGSNAAQFTGGSDAAFFVSDESSLANALAAIIASSQVFEKCNNLDDDCDTLVDEDFPNKGGACDNGLKGICRGTGAYQCKADGSGTQCVITSPGGTSTVETCNGLDDNCNGIIDDVAGGCQQTCTPEVCDGVDNDCDGLVDKADPDLTDVGVACGLNIGICTPGTTDCVSGALVCVGGTPAGTETCNGLDDDCDGVPDGMSRACYTGQPAGTQGVGPCHGGTQACVAVVGSGTPAWGACLGQVTPAAETCNGIDDDCNGTVDDVPTVGQSCCPSGNCGQGICVAGTNQCSGGTVQCIGFVGPATEVCNGIDDDCNGTIDDVPTVGNSCCPSGNCGVGVCVAGTLACQSNQLVCTGAVGPKTEICNNVDDDCNGSIDDLPGAGSQCCPAGIPCGVGICSRGTLQCVSGQPTLQCTGSVGPGNEVCNGSDDDCNGFVDDVPGSGTSCCTSGKCGTGICQAGVQKCQGTALACVNEVLPGTEICNTLDDDCNGAVDDVTGVGSSCCPYQSPGGTDLCGVGICGAGTLQCVAGSTNVVCTGATAPQPELCNALDDDCNGTVDDLPGGTVGGTCCPSGKCGTGICLDGTLGCGPSGIECLGAVNPVGETCNTLDDNCNGVVDDVPGKGTACCPSGRCGQGVCTAGVYDCVGTTLACVGATDSTPEVCDGLDNDCNGVVDDVPQLGKACCPGGAADGSDAPGACNKGVCRPGLFQCQGNALACVGGTGAGSETCDGLDNDCDGTIDETADVTANDPRVGQTCDPPQPPNDHPPCRGGQTICAAGQIVCAGQVLGTTEVCDGVDDDCDGVVDPQFCDSARACIDGVCRTQCASGEIPCPGGQICVSVAQGAYCVPESGTGGTSGSGGSAGAGADGGVTGGAAGTSSGGTTSSGGSAGSAASGGSAGSAASGGASSGGTSSGGTTSGGTSSGGTTSGGTTSGGASSGGSSASSGAGAESSTDQYGLATGGGGCACSTSRREVPVSSLLLAIATLAACVGRRARREGGAL